MLSLWKSKRTAKSQTHDGWSLHPHNTILVILFKFCINYLFFVHVRVLCSCVGMMESLHNELKEFRSDVKTTTILPYFVETNPKVTAQLELRYIRETIDVNSGDARWFFLLFVYFFYFCVCRFYATHRVLISDRPTCVFRFPEIPLNVACELIMKGILAEKRIFSVPGHVMHISSFTRYSLRWMW